MKKNRIFVGILIAALTVSVATPVLATQEEPAAKENTVAALAATNGFGQGEDGSWYYYVNGQIDSSCNDVIKDTKKQIDNTASWWYVVGGKVQKSFTGLANYKNENGWWYIKNGKVDFTHNGVDKNNNGWWYVLDGKVQLGYTGLANYKNENGWWYIKNGKVDFTHNGVDRNNNGWWYVTGGKVQLGYTGVANYSNENGWWYVQNGKVDFTADTVAKNNNGWWYVQDGKVQFGFTGLGNYGNANGWWYIKSGAVDFTHNGVDRNNNGWWYETGGKVQFDYTGVANYKNENGWWYCQNGAVDFTANGVYRNDNGWWYVKEGKVDFSFNGVAQNSNGYWYIENGKVNFNYNGTVRITEGTYTVVNGKVQDVILSDGAFSSSSDQVNAYDVSNGNIQYGGTETSQLAAPQFSGSVSKYGMTLTWDAVPGAAKYRVFRKKYGGEWQKIADTTKTTYLDSLWTDDTLYQYTVRCINSSGTTYTSPYISGYSGTEIAEYGQLFVGNPYVYGGISLTDGCDCSGFVMQVYAHFGYYMPHYSGDQIKLGKEVSKSNIQPGDVVGRTGHVALYIGDGKVVQARGAAYGICITKLSEVTYSTIRRFL